MKVKCDSTGIRLAVDAIKNGKVIIFPTDTVYGMGCDPFDSDAVRMIFELKHRDVSKHLPVLGYSQDVLAEIADLDESHMRLASRFWPGPLTIIAPLKDKRLQKSMGLEDKIAVRVPKNSCALEILKECKFLVGTSANVSGQNPSVDPDECFGRFEDISVFIDGGITRGSESTIVEQDGGMKILRRGAISDGELLH